MADRQYLVKWSAGECTPHASSPKQAIQIAVEYIQQVGADRITAELVGMSKEFHDAVAKEKRDIAK